MSAKRTITKATVPDLRCLNTHFSTIWICGLFKPCCEVDWIYKWRKLLDGLQGSWAGEAHCEPSGQRSGEHVMKHWKTVWLMIAACLWLGAGCNRGSDEREENQEDAQSSASSGHSKEGVVVLEPATQQNIALKTGQLEGKSLPREVKAYGQVMQAQPLVAQVAELASARTDLELATREWQRIKGLYDQNQNTSLRALQEAEAAMKRDQVAVDAIRLKLAGEWGNQLAQRNDLANFAKSLTTLDSALIRVHLPAGTPLDSPPVRAKITVPGLEGRSVSAGLVGPVAFVDPELQGQGFFFLLEPNSMSLVPGAAVTAELELDGPVLTGVLVPESAIVRQEKRAWVYVQTDDTTFKRQLVKLDHPLEDGWLVTETLKPGDRIVFDGAQVLLSEESKSKLQVGD